MCGKSGESCDTDVLPRKLEKVRANGGYGFTDIR